MGIRPLSAILAVVSSFWGALAFFFGAFSGFNLKLILIFLPGYAAWAFYVTRWLAVPPLRVRYLGWTLSLIVQSAWLIWACFFEPMNATRWSENPLLWWWNFATLVSVWALFREHRIPTQHERRPFGGVPKIS